MEDVNDISLTFLGEHYYEGNNTFLYVYLDGDNKGFYVYSREENSDLEKAYVINNSLLTYKDGVAIDSIDLNEDDSIIDYGYLTVD